MTHLTLQVPGTPAPQGSLKAYVRGGRPVVTSDNPKTRPWRDRVEAAAREQRPEEWPLDCAYVVTGWFNLPRPKSHYGRRGVRPSAPEHPIVKPDLDKLQRAVCDALTGVVWRDDSQVVGIFIRKRYVTDPACAGLQLIVEALR